MSEGGCVLLSWGLSGAYFGLFSPKHLQLCIGKLLRASISELVTEDLLIVNFLPLRNTRHHCRRRIASRWK